MSTLEARSLRQHRRVQVVPVCSSFPAPEILLRATELRRLGQLPWPRNLFGEPVTIVELMAEAVQSSEQDDEYIDDMCPCGCGKEHKQNVSQTLRNPSGRGFDVVYFWSDACKSRWNRERMKQPMTAG